MGWHEHVPKKHSLDTIRHDDDGVPVLGTTRRSVGAWAGN
jgi:hypothetical protein